MTAKHRLPLLPHPGHLRKQAKARLVAMRKAVPSARLAEAQGLIAREYGFSDWAALLQEVNRRASGPRNQRASLRRADLTPLHSQRFEASPDEDADLQTPGDFLRLGVMAQVGLIFAALCGMALVFIAIGPPRGVLATAWHLGGPVARLIRAIF